MKSRTKTSVMVAAIGIAGLSLFGLLYQSGASDTSVRFGYAGLSQLETNAVLFTATNDNPFHVRFHVFSGPGGIWAKRQFVAEGEIFPSNTYTFHVTWPTTNQWRLSGYYLLPRSSPWRLRAASFLGHIGMKKAAAQLQCPDPRRIDMPVFEMSGNRPK